jgi:hypothetical protein
MEREVLRFGERQVLGGRVEPIPTVIELVADGQHI